MDMWSAIAIIVVAGVIADIYKRKSKSENRALQDEDKLRIDGLEKRVESLETIVLEFDRERKFRDFERSR